MRRRPDLKWTRRTAQLFDKWRAQPTGPNLIYWDMRRQMRKRPIRMCGVGVRVLRVKSSIVGWTRVSMLFSSMRSSHKIICVISFHMRTNWIMMLVRRKDDTRLLDVNKNHPKCSVVEQMINSIWSGCRKLRSSRIIWILFHIYSFVALQVRQSRIAWRKYIHALSVNTQNTISVNAFEHIHTIYKSCATLWYPFDWPKLGGDAEALCSLPLVEWHASRRHRVYSIRIWIFHANRLK